MAYIEKCGWFSVDLTKGFAVMRFSRQHLEVSCIPAFLFLTLCSGYEKGPNTNIHPLTLAPFAPPLPALEEMTFILEITPFSGGTGDVTLTL